MKILNVIMTALVSNVRSLDPVPPGRETLPYTVSFADLGTGTGIIDSAYPDVVQFYSIPYSFPPVNERRFRIPKLMDSWDGELDLGKYPPLCHQIRRSTTVDWEPGVSEDCLYLNIYAPKEAIEDPTAKYPVQVYFHGGAYFFGSSNFVDGKVIADRQKIIVVSVAYRLGVFGFAHNSEFMKEDGFLGNFGSYDQRMALVWVNKFIENVGGDPTQVTISGCSAGGQSTMLHLTSPDSWPYFNKVVSFSGPNGLPYKNLTEAASINSRFFRNAQCCKDTDCKLADVDCLRSKTFGEIQVAAWGGGMAFPEVSPHLITYLNVNITLLRILQNLHRLQSHTRQSSMVKFLTTFRLILSQKAKFVLKLLSFLVSKKPKVKCS